MSKIGKPIGKQQKKEWIVVAPSHLPPTGKSWSPASMLTGIISINKRKKMAGKLQFKQKKRTLTVFGIWLSRLRKSQDLSRMTVH